MNDIWKIYMITCMKTNLSYIGQTKRDVCTRFGEHIETAYLKMINCQKMSDFYIDIVNYGSGYLRLQVLKDDITSQEDADYWERYYIKQYDTFKHGYNRTIGGQDGIYVLDDKDMAIVRDLYFSQHSIHEISRMINVDPGNIINSLKRENNFYGYKINPNILANPPWYINIKD